jgi:hypothetical protein
VRHHLAPYLALALSLLSAPAAHARTLTIRQPGAPELTFTVPQGWKATERRRTTLLTRGDQRRVLRQCPLARTERDMTGRHAAARHPRSTPVPGGSCLFGARGLKLHPVLGRGGRAPASDAEAEALARAARKRTLGQARVAGTALLEPFGFDRPFSSAFEWDLVSSYEHQVMNFGWDIQEVIRDRDGDHLRAPGDPCWGGTSQPADDDAFAPRLELHEWDAPPSTKTAWHVSYAPVERVGQVSHVRWTGFVADGSAEIADGRLVSIAIRDHHMARGRSNWGEVKMILTYPPQVTLLAPTPSC